MMVPTLCTYTQASRELLPIRVVQERALTFYLIRNSQLAYYCAEVQNGN